MLTEDSPELRKRRGAFFTPYVIAEHLAEWALRGEDNEGLILDPTCGEGVFLLAAAEQLAQSGGIAIPRDSSAWTFTSHRSRRQRSCFLLYPRRRSTICWSATSLKSRRRIRLAHGSPLLTPSSETRLLFVIMSTAGMCADAH